MDSHKNHKAFVQMAKWSEGTLGHNECCSARSPRSVPAWDLYLYFHEAQKQTVTEL